MSENTSTPAATTPAEKKVPRARWSEAQVAAICSKHGETSGPGWLARALAGCNIPHKVVDAALLAPEGTVLNYLKTGADIHYTIEANGAAAPMKLDTDVALEIAVACGRLKQADAFGPKGLDTGAVLQVLLNNDPASRA